MQMCDAALTYLSEDFVENGWLCKLENGPAFILNYGNV